METIEGRYVVPVDAQYLSRSGLAKYYSCDEFIFFPVDPRFLDTEYGYHLLNYVLAPSGRTYLCPFMYDLLQRQDSQLHINWDKIRRLPRLIRVNGILAGLKCCINFI